MPMPRLIALTTLLFAASTLAAPAKKAPPPPPAAPAPAVAPVVPPSDGSRSTRVIELDPTKTNRLYGIKTAIGIATILKFPESWTSAPVCGDCVFGDTKVEGGAQPLYRLDMDEPSRTITIKPIRLPGSQPEGNVITPDAFYINFGLNLAGGMTAVLTLQLVFDPADADAYVEFKLPGSALGKEKLSKLERDLEEQFDARVKQAGQAALLDAFMDVTRCKDFSGRPTREDSLVVRLKQLCKLNGYLYITFEAQNRARTEALLREASLSSTSGIGSTLTKIKQPLLRFNDRTMGVAAVELVDGNLPPSTFTLTVSEDGGKARVVTIEGIEF